MEGCIGRVKANTEMHVGEVVSVREVVRSGVRYGGESKSEVQKCMQVR